MPVKTKTHNKKKERIQQLETEKKILNVQIKNFLKERNKLYQKLKGENQDLENRLRAYGNLPQSLQVAEGRVRGLRWMLSQINQQKEEIKDELEHQLLLVKGADERWKEEIKKLEAEKKEVETWLDNTRDRYNAVNKRLGNEKVQLEILKHNQILELQEEIREKEIVIQKLENNLIILNQIAESDIRERERERERERRFSAEIRPRAILKGGFAVSIPNFTKNPVAVGKGQYWFNRCG